MATLSVNGSTLVAVVNASQLTTDAMTLDAGRVVPLLQAPNDAHSRFKIVKILNRMRGRWKCKDYAGPPDVGGEVAESRSEGSFGLHPLAVETLSTNGAVLPNDAGNAVANNSSQATDENGERYSMVI